MVIYLIDVISINLLLDFIRILKDTDYKIMYFSLFVNNLTLLLIFVHTYSKFMFNTYFLSVSAFDRILIKLVVKPSIINNMTSLEVSVSKL